MNYLILRSLPPSKRRLILIAIDALLIELAIWLIFWILLTAETQQLYFEYLWLFPAGLILGIPLFYLTGQYQGLSRFATSDTLYRLAGRNAILVTALFAISSISGFNLHVQKAWLLLWVILMHPI